MVKASAAVKPDRHFRAQALTFPPSRPVEPATAATSRRGICLAALYLDADPKRAVELAREALEAYPRHLSLRLVLANAMFTAGEAEAVLPLVRKLAAIDAETFVDPPVAYDKRIFGKWAYDLLGATNARLGRHAEAAAASGRAAELALGNMAYRVKAAAFSRSVT